MVSLARGRRCEARVGPSGSHALEGRLLAVRHCAGDGKPSVSVWAQRDRVAAQWAKGTGEAIEAVYDLENGRGLAGLRQRSTILEVMSDVGGIAGWQCSLAVVNRERFDPERSWIGHKPKQRE